MRSTFKMEEDFKNVFLSPLFTSVLKAPALVLAEHWYSELGGGLVADKEFSIDSLISGVGSLFYLIAILGFLLLPLQFLIPIYMNLISMAILGFLHFLTDYYVQEEKEEEEKRLLVLDEHQFHVYVKRQILQGASIVTLGMSMNWCLDLKIPFFASFIPYLFGIPMLFRYFIFLNISPEWITFDSLDYFSYLTTHFALFLCSVYVIFYVVPGIIRFTIDAIRLVTIIVEIEGSVSAISGALMTLSDPAVLIIYWIFTFLDRSWLEYNDLIPKRYILSDDDNLPIFVLTIASEICDSPLMLIGTCLITMIVSSGVIWIISKYLNSCKSNIPLPPDDSGINLTSGLTEGLIMFMLALQTDLIHLEMPDRMGAMSVILFIVLASLFQTLLEVTHPVLLALSSSAVTATLFSHFKVLLLCLTLFIAPTYMSYALYSTIEMDLWTLVVTSSAILTSIQVLGHVVHYCLFVYDSYHKEPLDSLDDIIYYLKAIIHSLELISALFVVCAGTREAYNGQWSILNIVVLSVHCYFNVWLRITNGWSSFLLRQKAVTQLSLLENATEAQLDAYNDICSICYMELTSAKITPCGHFYHPTCLKKWLFIQDHCPLCSQKVIETNNDAEDLVDTDEEEIPNEFEEENREVHQEL